MISLGRRNLLGVGGALALGGLLAPCRARAAGKPASIVNTAGEATLELEQLMRQQGYLQQMGLDPKNLSVGDGSKVVSALVSGDSDICIWSGFSQVFPAIQKGAKLKMLAGSAMLVEQTVYSKRPEIKSIADLEGKTIGTGSLGALLHQLMVALLQQKGVDIGKVKFVNIGAASDVFKAVVAGTVDAGPGPIAFYNQQAKYGVHSLTDGNMWSEIPQYTYQGAYAAQDAIDKKRDVLVRVLAAYAKLYRFIQSPDSKDAFVASRVAALKNSDPGEVREEAVQDWEFAQKYKPFAVDLVLSQDRIDYMQRLNVTLGIQKGLLPYDQVADMSLAREALKLI